MSEKYYLKKVLSLKIMHVFSVMNNEEAVLNKNLISLL